MAKNRRPLFGDDAVSERDWISHFPTNRRVSASSIAAVPHFLCIGCHNPYQTFN
jgi:hypothetical protein